VIALKLILDPQTPPEEMGTHTIASLVKSFEIKREKSGRNSRIDHLPIEMFRVSIN
jgi:hypothetical protein